MPRSRAEIEQYVKHLEEWDECGDSLEAREIIRELLEDRQWRPLETAPRDGTRILVYFKRHGWLTAAWTSPENSSFEIWCVDDFKFGPYAIRGYIETDVLGWMPLPEPPAERTATKTE